MTAVSIVRENPSSFDAHMECVRREIEAAKSAGHDVEHTVVYCEDIGETDRQLCASKVACACNSAIKACKSGFVCLVHDSDFFEPGALRWACEQVAHHPDAGMIVGDCRLVDVHSTTTWKPAPIEELTAEMLAQPMSHWFAGRCLVGPEVFFNVQHARALGGFDVARLIAFDYSLWLRFAMAGYGIHKHTRAVAYRIESELHPGPRVGDALRDVARAGLCVLSRVSTGRTERSGGDESWTSRAISEHTSLSVRSQALDVIEARMEIVDSREDQRVGLAIDNGSCVGQQAYRDGRWSLLKPHLVDVGRVVSATMRRARMTSPRVLRVTRDPERSGTTVRGWLPKSASMQCVDTVPIDGNWDCIVFDGVLVHTENVQETMQRAWNAVSDGGCLVVLGEFGALEALDMYLHRLRGRMRERVLMKTGVFLDLDADEQLERVFSAPAPVDFDAPADARAWVSTMPGWRGVDVFSMMQEIAPDATLRCARRYGSCWHHPVLPIPWIAALHVDQEDLWQIGVWQRCR